jgi:imidazolonepropionase-like amidohydrolase
VTWTTRASPCAATSGNRIFRFAGVIAARKVADLIAVEGNPLEDPTAVQRVRWVRWVMKGGTVYREAE